MLLTSIRIYECTYIRIYTVLQRKFATQKIGKTNVLKKIQKQIYFYIKWNQLVYKNHSCSSRLEQATATSSKIANSAEGRDTSFKKVSHFSHNCYLFYCSLLRNCFLKFKIIEIRNNKRTSH